MASKIINEDVLSDNEGVSLGSVGGYVKRFKEQEKRSDTIPFNPKKSFSSNEEVPAPSPKRMAKQPDPNVLPASLTEDNEKVIYVYYYCKFGNLDCDDFDRVKGKVASAINRLYGKSLTPSDAYEKLEKYVTPADIDVNESPLFSEKENRATLTSNTAVKTKSMCVEIQEGNYDFISNLNPLSETQLELVKFLDKKNFCFSSKDSNIFLAVHPKYEKCFDNLFKFSPKEQLVFSMFKEQLGDEHSARKLVLMSRMLNETEKSETPNLSKNTNSKKATKKQNAK